MVSIAVGTGASWALRDGFGLCLIPGGFSATSIYLSAVIGIFLAFFTLAADIRFDLHALVAPWPK